MLTFITKTSFFLNGKEESTEGKEVIEEVKKIFEEGR